MSQQTGRSIHSVEVERVPWLRRTLSEVVEGLPTLEHEFTQLGSGDESLVSTQALGCDSVVVGLRFSPLATGHILPDPRWCAFFAPLAWRGDFRYNGRVSEPGDLFLGDRTNGYCTSSSDRYTLCIGLRRERLRQACEALSGGPLSTNELQEQRLRLTTPIGERLLNYALALLPEQNSGQWRIPLPSHIEADLVSACAGLLIEQGAWTEFRDPGHVNPAEVVNRAKLAIDARYPQPISMAELCAASGIGKSWLHKCFVDVHGVSPMAFLRARRLTAARDWLVAGSERPKSVKDVALAFGFINGGRFAAEYRERFGETPSESLARHSCSDAGDFEPALDPV